MAYLGDFGGAYFGHWFGRLVEQAEDLLRVDQVFVATLRREIYANPQESRVDVLLSIATLAAHGETVFASRSTVLIDEPRQVVLTQAKKHANGSRPTKVPLERAGKNPNSPVAVLSTPKFCIAFTGEDTIVVATATQSLAVFAGFDTHTIH